MVTLCALEGYKELAWTIGVNMLFLKSETTGITGILQGRKIGASGRREEGTGLSPQRLCRDDFERERERGRERERERGRGGTPDDPYRNNRTSDNPWYKPLKNTPTCKEGPP